MMTGTTGEEGDAEGGAEEADDAKIDFYPARNLSWKAGLRMKPSSSSSCSSSSFSSVGSEIYAE